LTRLVRIQRTRWIPPRAAYVPWIWIAAAIVCGGFLTWWLAVVSPYL
jgi:hypothetical protein